ncbi:PREDICTED: S9 family peptidase [Prunus dulcis]|uniref:PREDICTED: S9 family peptidase n=1 Tax=Prunus dulcis TaxID=3755 RepID=A0A5E4FAG5_PRUDU|nr:PREDICTED: S9 family peptidase [Prunus dulcis]
MRWRLSNGEEGSEVASVSEERMSQMAFFLSLPPPHHHTDIYVLLNFNISDLQPTATSPLEVKQITAPYGSWKSPIATDDVSAASKLLAGTAVDSLGPSSASSLAPMNPGTRMVVVREPERAGEGPVDITPKEYAVRTVAQGSESGDSSPTPLTPDYGGPIVSYADGVFDARFNHARQSTTDPITTIVAVELDSTDIRGKFIKSLSKLNPSLYNIDVPRTDDYCANDWHGLSGLIPTCHGIKLNSRLAAYLRQEKSTNVSALLAVILQSESLQPNPSGLLKVESNNEVISVYSWDAEFSRPLCNFGMNSYELIQSHEQNILIACSYRENGRSYLGILDDVQGSFSVLNIPFTDIDNITLGINCLYVEGASEVHPLSVAKVTLDDHKSKAVAFKIIWSSSPDYLKYKPYFSLPKVIRFPTEVPGQTAFAYFYTPSNPDYQATQEEKPPLLLQAHGGPTFESHGILNLSIQYWTSQGWAFVAVNYGGSSGFGREYRERLLRKWGIVDVNDCCSCARYLVDSGKVDGNRLCITGDSAGGYTTLAALAFRDTFKAGASLYGIADLTMLRAETQKFESHYIDSLVGSEKDYFERSPINFVDRFSCPIILFQGLEDKDNGLPVALVEYEGEQHGFRKAENIKFTLEQQMVFFARLVGHFKVADDITPF